MKERPILFSGPMVRAILEGRKNMTRQIVKPAKDRDIGCVLAPCEIAGEINRGDLRNSPYQIGDRLYVRETTINVEEHGYIGPVYLESNDGRSIMDWGLAPAPDDCTEVEPHELKLRPSARMPKSIARIWLEVIGVRVEKLRDISDADAKAEGICELPGQAAERGCWWAGSVRAVAALHGRTPRHAYRLLWERINGPGSWNANPFCWVITFRRVS